MWQEIWNFSIDSGRTQRILLSCFIKLMLEFLHRLFNILTSINQILLISGAGVWAGPDPQRLPEGEECVERQGWISRNTDEQQGLEQVPDAWCDVNVCLVKNSTEIFKCNNKNIKNQCSNFLRFENKPHINDRIHLSPGCSVMTLTVRGAGLYLFCSHRWSQLLLCQLSKMFVWKDHLRGVWPRAGALWDFYI